MSYRFGSGSVLRNIEGHYAYVLLSLVAILALHAFIGEGGVLEMLLEAAYVVTILSCLLVSVGRRTWRIILISAMAAEMLAIVARMSDITVLATPGRVLRVLVLFVVMFAVLRDVLRSRAVTMNTVFAAASVYLLMALGWASIFMALEATQPGAFNLSQTSGAFAMAKDTQLLYFSMITLTTVGYGDITPLSPQARTLAALEGLIGQLYVAIIIARLVALEISGRRDQDAKKGS